MDFALNEEQQMYRRAVRDFCERELKPHAAEVDESAQLHWEAIHKMPQLGLTGLQVPEQYGGADLDTVSAALALEEIGRVCGSTALSIAAHNGLGCFPLVQWGTDAQKDRYLPRLTSGETLGALALTEPGAGSDLRGVKTVARRDGDEWVINGSKAWITNPLFSSVIVVFVRTDPEAGSRGYSLILVEPDADGLTLHPPEKKMGVRGSPTQMMTFADVRVPLDNLLGEEGGGLHQTLRVLDGGRIGIGAITVGLAQGALEEALRYAQEREAFGQPISQFQAIQWMIADGAMLIDAARLLLWQAAWRKDQGQPFTKQAAMGKLLATETAEQVCYSAIQIHGSYGYSREFPVERMYRDQRVMSIGEGTSEIQRLVIARQVLAEYGL